MQFLSFTNKLAEDAVIDHACRAVRNGFLNIHEEVADNGESCEMLTTSWAAWLPGFGRNDAPKSFVLLGQR